MSLKLSPHVVKFKSLRVEKFRGYLCESDL
nr:MAG TPA: hypothetical protein [Caudoviricetes sp.]